MKKRLHPLLALAALLVVLALGLSWLVLKQRPQQLAPRDPFALLPSSCEAVVVIDDSGRLGEHLSSLAKLRLVQLAASLVGQPSSDALIAQWVRELGFDPRVRESFSKLGFDPSRPVVGHFGSQGSFLLGLPATDFETLEETVARHAGRRLAAKERKATAGAMGTLVSFHRPLRPEAELSMVRAGDYLLLSPGPQGPERLRAALQLKPEHSLARQAGFARARSQLGERDLFAYLCPGSSWAPSKSEKGGATAGLILHPSEIKLALTVPLEPAQAARLASLQQPAGADLMASLDPAAVAVARLGGDPALLEPFLNELLPRYLRAAFVQGGIDPAQEVFGNLQPGIALSLGLASSAQLGMVPALNLRRTNPFQFLSMQLLARPKDPSKAQATLDKVVAVAPRFGAQVEAREAQGAKVFTTRYHLGEGASFALKDGVALFVGGPGQMETTLARLASPPRAAPSESVDQALMARVDVARLVAAVRELPDAAYGIGGFAIRAAIARWLEAIEQIAAIRLQGNVRDSAFHADLSIGLRPGSTAAKESAR